MAAGITQLTEQQAANREIAHPLRWYERCFSPLGREVLLVGLTLVGAAALRLGLAARGWPTMNSDQAILGLMASDVLRHGAHPIFYYGQHYMGALQAYLTAPFVALFGLTTFALAAAATFQTCLFLLLLYLFARIVYSPGVAWCSLALLALGPDAALTYELRPGAGSQDTLVFGALLLVLVVLRLRRPPGKRMKVVFNLGIGLTIGVGLWCDFLILPFLMAACLALGTRARQRLRAAPGRATRRGVQRQGWLIAFGALIGLGPAIVATIASRGLIFSEVLAAAGVPDSADTLHMGVFGLFFSLGQQVLAAVFISLPRILGYAVVCGSCVAWPAPHVSATLGQVLVGFLIAAPFSLAAFACWLSAARPHIRVAWGAFRARRQRHEQTPGSLGLDYRWWGRAMLVLGGALTFLPFALARSSYTHVNAGSIRYLVGLYLCVPLVADPLWRGLRQFFAWRRVRRQSPDAPARPRLKSALAAGLLLAILVVNIASAANAFQVTRDQQTYGVPAGQRDQQVITFLITHNATRFYASYWVCYQLAFESQERAICAVISSTDAFAIGGDRKPDYVALVAAAPHPAYVFDLRASDLQPSVPAQVAERLAAGDLRFAGYTSVVVAGYLIYYYAGG